jgi:hypothetical protein
MIYRKVVSFERREKARLTERCIYPHWFRVRLKCGHYDTAKPVKGGLCPKTVACDTCNTAYTQAPPQPAV